MIHIIQEIADRITNVSDMVNVIASAVEEQEATTKEINRSIHEASVNSSQVADHIERLSNTAHNTHQRADFIKNASSEVSNVSNNLKNLIDGFNKHSEN